MKIPNDLRLTITAAAKAQPKFSYFTAGKELHALGRDLLKKHPAVKKSATAQAKKLQALKRQVDQVRDQLGKTLATIGLRYSSDQVECNFSIHDIDETDNEAVQAYVKAGGQLPKHAEPWKAQTVIAELAAAPPEQLNTILAKYDIQWT